MMDLSLHNNDLNLDKGDFSLCLTDSETIAQSISIRLRTFLGEWVLDENKGIPYLIEVFGRKVLNRSIKKLINQEIISLPDVVNVEDLRVELSDKRSLAISFKVVLCDRRHLTIKESIGV